MTNGFTGSCTTRTDLPTKFLLVLGVPLVVVPLVMPCPPDAVNTGLCRPSEITHAFSEQNIKSSPMTMKWCRNGTSVVNYFLMERQIGQWT